MFKYKTIIVGGPEPFDTIIKSITPNNIRLDKCGSSYDKPIYFYSNDELVGGIRRHPDFPYSAIIAVREDLEGLTGVSPASLFDQYSSAFGNYTENI